MFDSGVKIYCLRFVFDTRFCMIGWIYVFHKGINIHHLLFVLEYDIKFLCLIIEPHQ